jgi:hypothetical protein
MTLDIAGTKQDIIDGKSRLWPRGKNRDRMEELVDKLGGAVKTELDSIDASNDMLTDATAAVGGKIELREGTDNGVNKITVQAPAALAADRTITFPDADVDLSKINALAAVGDPAAITSAAPAALTSPTAGNGSGAEDGAGKTFNGAECDALRADVAELHTQVTAQKADLDALRATILALTDAAQS